MRRYVLTPVAKIRSLVQTMFGAQQRYFLKSVAMSRLRSRPNLSNVIFTLKFGLGGDTGSVCLYGEMDLEGQEGSSPKITIKESLFGQAACITYKTDNRLVRGNQISMSENVPMQENRFRIKRTRL